MAIDFCSALSSLFGDFSIQDDELDRLQFGELHRKYGLDALCQKFSSDQLKEKFNEHVRNPKVTFWSILQSYDLQDLFDHHIIDPEHFRELETLKQRAESYGYIHFLSGNKMRDALTLFANAPQAFRAIIAMDEEYKKSRGVEESSFDLPPEILNGKSTEVPPSIQMGSPRYYDVRIRQAVWGAFTALAGLSTAAIAAVAHFKIYRINLGLTLVALTATIACFYFALRVIDYKDPKTQGIIRQNFEKSRFADMYHVHGLANLLQIFTAGELKEKFNAEIQDEKTTFWNVLRRYDLQELCQAGVITAQHVELLKQLDSQSKPLHLLVFCGVEQWKGGLQGRWFTTRSSHHVATAFANAPEAYRKVDALDKVYKDRVKDML